MYELPAYPEPCASPGNKVLGCGYGFRVVICNKDTIDDMLGWIAKFSEAREVVEGDFQPVSPHMHLSIKRNRTFQTTPLLLTPHLPMEAYGHIPASIMPQTYEWVNQKYLRLGSECVAELVEFCVKMAAKPEGLRRLKEFLRAGDYRLSEVHFKLISMVNEILFDPVSNIDVKAFIGARYLITDVHAFVMWFVTDFKRHAAIALKGEPDELPGLLNAVALRSMRKALSRWPLDSVRSITPTHTTHHYQHKRVRERPVAPFKTSVHSVLEGDRTYAAYQRAEASQARPFPLIAFVQGGAVYSTYWDRLFSLEHDDEETGVVRFERQHKRGPVTNYVYSSNQKSMMEDGVFSGHFLYVTEGPYHLFIKLI